MSINVDASYFCKSIEDEEKTIKKFEDDIDEAEKDILAGVSYPMADSPPPVYINYDIYKFMEKTRKQYDIIFLNRILEHVPMDKVLYFIYLLSTVTSPNHSLLSIVVPDYKVLAKRLLNEQVYEKGFIQENILLTTEMLNEPNDPHASIWTIDRLKYFFEFEKRFCVRYIKESFEYDKRDIYLHALVERI
jgi:hypothetical protein